MYKQWLNHLANSPLFKHLDTQVLEQLLYTFNPLIKTYQVNEIIYVQHQVCHSLDVILDGQIIIENIGENGHSFIVTKFNTNDIIGGILFFDQHNYYPMTLTASKKTTLLKFSENQILSLAQNDRQILKNLLHLMSTNTQLLATKINTLTMLTLRQKINHYLLQESLTQKSKQIILTISKTELANRFGVNRTSLSRELKKMVDEGFITNHQQHIHLLAPLNYD